VIPCVLALAIAVMLWVFLEHAQMWIQIAQVIVMFVVQATVHQMPVYVLATVSPVLVQVQTIAVRPTTHYVLVIVMFVLAQAQHIIVQQIILFVLATLAHVTVQAVVQCLIVSHVRILMVHAESQLAAIMCAATTRTLVGAIVLMVAMIMERQIITAVQGLVFVPLAHIPPHPMEKTMIVMDSRTKRLALHRPVAVFGRAHLHAVRGVGRKQTVSAMVRG